MMTGVAARVGQQKQTAGLSEAQRNAETLFESKTVTEIREIENRTRKDIEQKKLQLRQLVGDSYKDLIENADKIVSIARNSESILANIKSVQDAFSSLAHSFATADALLNEKRDSLTKHEELYAVGSRIKYLVDTPELIWGCLDSKQYLEAARRYLRAEQVHAQLKANFDPSVLAKFPLLRHHWPTVTKFKKQIVDAVQASLSKEKMLTTAQAADAVVAVAALQGLDSAAALQIFLAGRRAWLHNHLATSTAATRTEDVAQALCELSQAIQLTVSQIGELFLASNATASVSTGGKSPDAACRLQATAREDEVDASELLFGGRSATSAAAATPSGGATAASPEIDAWRKATRSIVERLTALSSGQVEVACMSWLREVCEDFSQRCKALLACCTTAEALVSVEAAVRSAIATWQHPSLSKAGNGPLGLSAKRQRAMSSALATPLSSGAVSVVGVVLGGAGAGAGLGAAGGMGGVADAHLESWEAACEWVLGRPLNLWQEVFHAPFVQRSKELLASAFAAVAAAVEEPLTEALRQAAAATPEPAGNVPSKRWPQGLSPSEALLLSSESTALGGGLLHTPSGTNLTDTGLARAWSDKLASSSGRPGGRLGVTGQVAGAADDKVFRQAVQSILHRLDSQLLAILQAVHKLVGGAELSGAGAGLSPVPSLGTDGSASGIPTVPSQRALLASMSVKRDMMGSRAADLEPFAQQQCADLAASLAAMLQEKLAALPGLKDGTAGAPAAEQVLLLGRLASALGADSRYLPVVLGAPEGWRTAISQAGGQTRSGATAMRPSARAGVANVRLQAVVERFRAVSVAAYRLWAQWAASSLAGQLQSLVLADTLLSSTGLPLSWQEIVIAGAHSDAAADPLALPEPGAGDMRFHLPASPSCAVLQYIMAGCQEVKRAGDHRIAPEALQILEWELAGAAFKAYAAMLAPGGALDTRLSEKGVLQLLMDVRFTRDMFAGGRPLADAAPTAGLPSSGTASVSASSSALSSLPGTAGPSALLPELQDPAVMAAQNSRKREVSALEQLLQDRLDPIDWATYESYLWSNVQKYYQRVSVLFGLVVQLQRVHGDAPGKALASMQDSNPLNVLPVVQRFQYLPISAPLGASAGAGASRSRINLASLSISRANSSAVCTNDLAASYSFADLGVSRAAGAGSLDEAGSHGAAGSSAFMARLQASGPSALGTLSSLLGDKAAEMSATLGLAQQKLSESSFSDFLPTAAGGLLSTFAKNVVKK